MEKLKQTKILGIIGSILLIISVFLPMLVEKSILGEYSLNWIKTEGIFVVVLAVVNLILIFSDKLSDKIVFMEKLKNPKLILIPTGMILIMLLLLTFSPGRLVASASGVSGSYAQMLETYLGEYIQFGIGFYIAWAGILLSAIHAVFHKTDALD
ncbi:MAG: hypothetical protein ACLU84_04770 [Clostridia bacterium]